MAIGFTQLYPSFSSLSLKSVWILNDLYVYEEYRKQGVGKMLLDAAKEFALKQIAKGLLFLPVSKMKQPKAFTKNTVSSVMNIL